MINSLKDMKKIYGTYFLLIAVVIFVVIYCITNYNELSMNNLFSGDIVKPILITGILLLLSALFLSDEQEGDDFDSMNSKIYKIMNDKNQFEKFEEINNTKENDNIKKSKNFQILNDNNNQNHIKHESKYKKHKNNIVNSDSNSNSNYKEKNIKRNVFLPYKENTIKFALKT